MVGLRPVALVGFNGDCLSFARHLERHPLLGMTARAMFTVDQNGEADSDSREQLTYARLRQEMLVMPRRRLAEWCQQHPQVETVFICCPPNRQGVILRVLNDLRDLPVTVNLRLISHLCRSLISARLIWRVVRL